MKSRSVFIGVLLLMGVGEVCRAQSGTTGTLTGTVVNGSGAPLPGASVVLRSEATAQEQTATTGADGRFAFPALAPDTYGIRFSAQGYKAARLAGVVVNVSEDTVLDARLEAGSTELALPCNCTVAHAASSSTSTLVDSKAITAVPLTSRNLTQVLSTASGASSDVTNAGLLGAGNQNVNVNGNTVPTTFTIDGAADTVVPNPDTITQFRIQTSQYDSGYGAHVPATNLITKSGANAFHGALWEFVRNDAFNANTFFRNANGQPKPSLKQNQFGGAVGGPVKQDKLFFFISYQATRQINGVDASALSTLNQPALTNDRSAAAIGAQFCPQNHPRNDGLTGQSNNPFYAFAGGTAGAGVQVACDGSNINPIALKILQLKLPDGSYWIPTPQHVTSAETTDADPTKRYRYNLGQSSYSFPSSWNQGHYLFNIDYLISKTHTLAFRFFFAHAHQTRMFGNYTPGPAFVPGGPETTDFATYATSLKLTSVVTPRLVNDVRMTFTRVPSWARIPGLPSASSLGMTPVDPFFDEPPETTIQGTLGSFRFFGNGQGDSSGSTVTYQWADNLSWVHGKHTLRTGIFIDATTQTRFDTGLARGKITFQSFADFLLGLSATQNGSPTSLSNIDSVSANEGSGPRGEVQYKNRYSNIGVFLQDDFKLRPRFTLNLGLRWEYLPASFDLNGQMGNVFPSLLTPIPPVAGTYVGNTVAANYDPATINPYTGKAFGPPPAGVVVRSTRSLYEDGTPLNTFAPRFGFAWQPGSKQARLSLRGGYGWFFQNPSTGGNAAGTPTFTAPPFAQGFSNTAASNNLSTLQKPFPTTTLGFQLRTPTSQLSDRIGGPEYIIPMLQQWNLTMQMALIKTLTLDVGYAGSFGTHLLVARGLNQPLLASVQHPVNCGYNGGDPANLANCITSNTASNAARRVPFLGETPTALAVNEYTGMSRYNGLQATLRKQVSRGLSFQLSYTYSKSMNNLTRLNDQTNGRLDWARANFDRTQRLVFSYTYLLPNFGRREGFAGALLSGWSLSGVTSVQTGTPLTLIDRSGGSIYGRAANSTITLCPGATYADLITPGGAQDRLGKPYSANGWFNPAAICNAAALGDESAGPRATGYGNAGQGILVGPGQNDWDFSLGKTSRVGGLHEESELQVRVEFYNAFNHPQFSNPGTTLGTSTFGVISQTSVASRLIQFGVKYLF